jgi:glyoxylase-like metal-dependent hydrolase (beta-lactamase superfamily II)
VFAHGGFGRYDFPGGDFNTLLNSIKGLTELDVINLYPGHGPIVESNAKDHVIQSYKSIQSLI